MQSKKRTELPPVADVKSNDDATEIYGALGNPSIIPKGKVGQGQFSESTDDLEDYSQTVLSLETTSTRLVGELYTSMKFIWSIRLYCVATVRQV